ncbi:MAG: hypothetical protein U5K69_16200 [Balneolaceae bacterium]|nr:hypothetical protein [Balneolaceae bacterium]
MSISTVDKSYSQSVLGARAIALGQASTALPDTEWSVFANPAMMNTDRRTISFFGIRYYGFSEITDMAASVNYPFKYGVLGAGAHRYGFDLFSKNRMRVTYKNAFQNFHYGAALNYSHVSQGGGYGSAGAIGVDVGIAAALFEGAWIAAIMNINQPEDGDIDEVLPRELAVGFPIAFRSSTGYLRGGQRCSFSHLVPRWCRDPYTRKFLRTGRHHYGTDDFFWGIRLCGRNVEDQCGGPKSY